MQPPLTCLFARLTVGEWEKTVLSSSLLLPTNALWLHPVQRVLLLYNPFAGAKRGSTVAQNAYTILSNSGVVVRT